MLSSRLTGSCGLPHPDAAGSAAPPSSKMPPRPLSACIFDFDGTLVDTEQLNLRAAQAALAEYGAKIPLVWLAARPLKSVDELYERLWAERGVLCSPRWEVMASAQAYWLAHAQEQIRPIGHVTSAVYDARTRGPVAVVFGQYASDGRGRPRCGRPRRPVPGGGVPGGCVPDQAVSGSLLDRCSPARGRAPALPCVREHRRRRRRGLCRRYGRNRRAGAGGCDATRCGERPVLDGRLSRS
jgi:hypothetical protein